MILPHKKERGTFFFSWSGGSTPPYIEMQMPFVLKTNNHLEKPSQSPFHYAKYYSRQQSHFILIFLTKDQGPRSSSIWVKCQSCPSPFPPFNHNAHSKRSMHLKSIYYLFFSCVIMSITEL